MKKLLFLAMIVLGTSLATAQSKYVKNTKISDANTVEIIITKRLLSNNVNVQVDAGQDTSFFGSFFAPRYNHYVTDSDTTNDRYEFESTSEVLDYFQGMGYMHHGENGYSIRSVGRSGLSNILTLGLFNTFVPRGQRLILHKMDMAMDMDMKMPMKHKM